MNEKPGEAANELCIVITYPYALGAVNGGARCTREVARHLGQLGADVIVLPVSATPYSHFPRPIVDDRYLGFEFDAEFSQDSVEVVRVPQHPLHWRLDGRSVRNALAKILKRRRVDIVLSYYHEAAALPTFLRPMNVKFGYIATWQSYAVALGPRRQRWVSEFVRKRLDNHFTIQPYKQAEILFATSHFTRGELIDVVGVDSNRIVVCYLGVDPVFLGLPRPAPEKITRFLFFGRLDQSKGILDAIQALGKVAKMGHKNWQYRIQGVGGQEWIRNAAATHGISDQVVVSDPVPEQELHRELTQTHLAIMPSHYESFGLSIAEAQAAGIPVIAYHAGSVPEVVENGVTGWLAPLRDVDGLARYIEQAIQNPEMTHRAGLAGRKRIADTFTWQKAAATIADGVRTLKETDSVL